MPKSLYTARIFLGLAALMLAATGALHATGFSTVAGMVDSSGIPNEWAPVLKGLWLMFSIHLVILAALVISMAVRPTSRLALGVAVLMPIADTILLLVTVGVFIGTLMVGLAVALLLLGLVALPSQMDRASGAAPLADSRA